MRLLDHVNDSIDRVVLDAAHHLHFDRAGCVDAAGNDLTAHAAGDWDRFTRYCRLVELGVTFDDGAIDRNAIPGTHQHQLADREGVDGDRTDAVALNDGLVDHPGVVATALVPHLIGSFLGLVLLGVAAWRARAVPRTAVVLMIAFLVWDFLLPPLGPVDPHVLLVVAWVWMGVHLLRMPDAAWRGAPAAAA